ncbi:MAG: hypothetical protein OEV35_05430, partial [Gallionellaceae bacterium]|nr:hypothetical protein [Gallionellaceae bacterium]
DLFYAIAALEFLTQLTACSPNFEKERLSGPGIRTAKMASAGAGKIQEEPEYFYWDYEKFKSKAWPLCRDQALLE